MCRSGPASDEMQTNQGVASASALLQHELEAAQGRHEQLVEAIAEAAHKIATASAKLEVVSKTMHDMQFQLASCEVETRRALAVKREELRVELVRRLERLDEATEVRKRSFPRCLCQK